MPLNTLYLSEHPSCVSNLPPSLDAVCNLFQFSKISSPSYSTSLSPSFLTYVGGRKHLSFLVPELLDIFF